MALTSANISKFFDTYVTDMTITCNGQQFSGRNWRTVYQNAAAAMPRGSSPASGSSRAARPAARAHIATKTAGTRKKGAGRPKKTAGSMSG